MIAKLIIFLERQLRYCDSYDNSKVAYDQAFGAVSMYIDLFPNEFYQVEKMWYEEYKPQFERKVWGIE